MNRKFLYWFFLIVILLLSVFGFYFLLQNYYFNNHSVVSSPIVEYFDYDSERDFSGVEALIERYKFWLFHGDFPKGECPLNPNLRDKIHSSDFDSSVNVPYFIKIAKVGDRCVGFISYYISLDNACLEKGKAANRLGRVHLLCVDEQYRRLGIAKELVNFVIDFFKKNNCQKAYLITRPENIRAKNLYYKFGFYEVERNDVLKNVFDANPADVLLKEL